MTELVKPCPFCGGSNIRFDSHPSGDRRMTVWSMCCYACGATFPNRYKRELLEAAWNTRAETAPLDPLKVRETNDVRWNGAGRVHDWRNYVSEEVRQMWGTFTDEQRAALQRQADEQASKEEWD